MHLFSELAFEVLALRAPARSHGEQQTQHGSKEQHKFKLARAPAGIGVAYH